MTLNDFTTVYPEATDLDSNKRVNYVHGLVLGVDEFKQQEHYLLEKDRLHNRSLHGHGTVCGLGVSREDTAAGIEIQVSPGIALCANGQVVEVQRNQCALINEWLAGNSEPVLEQLGSPMASELSLYLMLCYRECASDYVPVPTGPCHSLEDSTAPSRIADDFSLSFELVPPDYVLTEGSPEQPAMEDPLARFLELLYSIPVVPGGALTVVDMRDWVRSLVDSSPDVMPDFGSPPTGMSMDPDNVADLLHAAFVAWVTEVKPCLQSHSLETVPADPYANCVFLAEVNLEITLISGVPQLVPGSNPIINERARPFLLDSRTMQEVQTSLLADSLSTGPGVGIRKRIAIPARTGVGSAGAARSVLNGLLPSMRLPTAGAPRVLLSMDAPDDIDVEQGMRVRLFWGWQAAAGREFDWRVGAAFLAANDAIGGLEDVDFGVSEPAANRDTLLVTEFQDFNASLVLDSGVELLVIEVSTVDTGGNVAQIHLVQVEVEYTSNGSGG